MFNHFVEQKRGGDENDPVVKERYVKLFPVLLRQKKQLCGQLLVRGEYSHRISFAASVKLCMLCPRPDKRSAIVS